MIGFYRPLVDSVKGWASLIVHGDWSMALPLLGVIGCFGLGCLIGVVLVSKVMSFLLAKYKDNTFFTIIGFILGSICVLFFSYEIFRYYQCWAGVSFDNIHPIWPMYVEIPVGIVILIGCMVGSYFLVRLERKKRQEKQD